MSVIIEDLKRLKRVAPNEWAEEIVDRAIEYIEIYRTDMDRMREEISEQQNHIVNLSFQIEELHK